MEKAKCGLTYMRGKGEMKPMVGGSRNNTLKASRVLTPQMNLRISVTPRPHPPGMYKSLGRGCVCPLVMTWVVLGNVTGLLGSMHTHIYTNFTYICMCIHDCVYVLQVEYVRSISKTKKDFK
jgi:hypothetical protein